VKISWKDPFGNIGPFPTQATDAKSCIFPLLLPTMNKALAHTPTDPPRRRRRTVLEQVEGWRFQRS